MTLHVLVLSVLVAACAHGGGADPGGTGTGGTGGTGGSGSGSTPPGVGALSKDDSVYAAVFLHEIAASGLAQDETICLATRGLTSDGVALVAAIQARYPTAVRDSECGGGGPTGPVTLTATGGKAVRFDVGPITWGPDGRPLIHGGGGHRGGATSREVEYTLEPSGDTWKVVGERVVLEI